MIVMFFGDIYAYVLVRENKSLDGDSETTPATHCALLGLIGFTYRLEDVERAKKILYAELSCVLIRA